METMNRFLVLNFSIALNGFDQSKNLFQLKGLAKKQGIWRGSNETPCRSNPFTSYRNQ
jgi:hypothetical protein